MQGHCDSMAVVDPDHDGRMARRHVGRAIEKTKETCEDVEGSKCRLMFKHGNDLWEYGNYRFINHTFRDDKLHKLHFSRSG